jgi:hypothetical protein
MRPTPSADARSSQLLETARTHRPIVNPYLNRRTSTRSALKDANVDHWGDRSSGDVHHATLAVGNTITHDPMP